jgi:hypothetical protein
MLTDILIVSRGEASTILEQYPQRRDWPRLELKGLDNTKLAALLEALGASAEAPALEGEGCLVASRKEGPWVFVLPTALRDLLANLPEGEFRAVAERWAAHEELVFDEWTADDVEPGIGMLKEQAKKSAASGKDLLLWMSL